MGKGEIHIKKGNEGKFGEWARRHGMGVQEAARYVLAHRERYSGAVVKQANFARNAAKWKHEEGGEVYVPAYATGGMYFNPYVDALRRLQMGGEGSSLLPVTQGGTEAKWEGDPNSPVFFKTERDRERYIEQLKREAKLALQKGDDSDYLRYGSYHPRPDGLDCINGICGLDIKAGLRFNKAPFVDRYISNIGLVNDINAGKADYYQVDGRNVGNIREGDHLMNVDIDGRPYHSMQVYQIDKGKDGKPAAYRIIQNKGNTEFVENVYTPDELQAQFTNVTNGRKRNMKRDALIAWRPGADLDWNKLARSRGVANFPYARGEQAVEDYFGDTYLPARFSLKASDSGLTPDSPLYYLSGKDVQDQEMNELIALMNDKELDRALRKELRINDATLQNLKPVIFGISKTETDHGLVGLGRSIKEGVAEALTDNPSVGRFQVRPGSVSERAQKAFGINSVEDLKDLRKGYIAAVDRMLEAKRITDEQVAKGLLPGLENADPSFRAAYYYNQPQRVLKGDEAWAKENFAYEPDVALPFMPNLSLPGGDGATDAAAREAAFRKFLEEKRLRGDSGSYMQQVMQGASPLLMEVLDDEEAQSLPAVEVVGKKKKPAGSLPQQQMGGVSRTGYKANSPDRFNDFNIIPSNMITMRNVPHPVMGIDNMGAAQVMYPGWNYRFPGQAVFEVPMPYGSYMQTGGQVDLSQAQLVSQVPKGYSPYGIYNDKSVYGKEDSVSLPMATGRGIPGAGYENYLREQLAAGVRPEELVRTRRIEPAHIERYRKYYKPRVNLVYTQPPAPAPVPRPAPTPTDKPVVGFNGEPVYYPNKHLAGYAQNPTRVSTGQGDAGMLNTAMQPAKFMFVDRMGRVDTSRGEYNIPADVWSNRMVRGTNVLQDSTGLSQYKKPSFQLGGEEDTTGFMGSGNVNPFYANPYFNNHAGAVPPANFPTSSVPASGVPATRELTGRPLGIGAQPIPIPYGPVGSIASRYPTLSPVTPPAEWTQPKESTTTLRGPNIGLAQGITAGMAFVNNALENYHYNNQERKRNRALRLGDNMGSVTPGSRGKYTMNTNYFDPLSMVPVQFGAVPMAQEGGYFADPMQAPVLETPPELFAAMPASNPASDSVIEKEFSSEPVRIKRDPNEAAWNAFHYYVNDKSLEPHIAAGIVGNLYQESRLKADAVEKEHTGNGRGIAQWDVRDRWQGFLKWANESGRNPNDMYAQLDYVLEEPGEGKRALEAMAQTDNPVAAADIFRTVFERPTKDAKVAGNKTRAGIAQKLYDGFMGSQQNMMAYNAPQPAGGARMFQKGGEYEVTPKQLQFILANGGEVEFL